MTAVESRWQDELQPQKQTKGSSTLQDLLQSARSLRQSVLLAPAAAVGEEALSDEGMWHAVFSRQRRSRARHESTARIQQQQQQSHGNKQQSTCADFEFDEPAPPAKYAPFHSGIGKRTCSDASLSPVRQVDRMMTREHSMMTSFSKASSQWGDCSQATSAAALSAGALLRSDSVLQAQFGMLRQQLRERGLADLADAGTRRCSQSTYDDGLHRPADVDGLDSFRRELSSLRSQLLDAGAAWQLEEETLVQRDSDQTVRERSNSSNWAAATTAGSESRRASSAGAQRRFSDRRRSSVDDASTAAAAAAATAPADGCASTQYQQQRRISQPRALLDGQSQYAEAMDTGGSAAAAAATITALRRDVELLQEQAVRAEAARVLQLERQQRTAAEQTAELRLQLSALQHALAAADEDRAVSERAASERSRAHRRASAVVADQEAAAAEEMTAVHAAAVSALQREVAAARQQASAVAAELQVVKAALAAKESVLDATPAALAVQRRSSSASSTGQRADDSSLSATAAAAVVASLRAELAAAAAQAEAVQSRASETTANLQQKIDTVQEQLQAACVSAAAQQAAHAEEVSFVVISFVVICCMILVVCIRAAS
jgi:hypothetical protein